MNRTPALNQSFRFVVGVLEHSGSKSLRNKFASAAAKFGFGAYPLGIVMNAADRNLAVIKLQERPTFQQIVRIMRQVALAFTSTPPSLSLQPLTSILILTLTLISCGRWLSLCSICMITAWCTLTSNP